MEIAHNLKPGNQQARLTVRPALLLPGSSGRPGTLVMNTKTISLNCLPADETGDPESRLFMLFE